MTFNSTYYTGVVINDFDSGSTVFDDSGTFATNFRLKAANIPLWAGKTVYALMIEVGYDHIYLTDEGDIGPLVDSMNLDETHLTLTYDVLGSPVYNNIFIRDESFPGSANCVFQPEPINFNPTLYYAGDPDFIDPLAPPYRYYMVLDVPTIMPTEAQLLDAVDVHYHQHVIASRGISPYQRLYDPGGPYYYQWSLRLTVYIGGALPPLRLFQRDDDLGKVGTARLGGHTPVGNPPSSLQRQSPPRLVQGGNVYL